MYTSDKSADGVFITGVLTTGIYCLPSCPARKPKAENVRFYESEAEAKGAGLRACKRCRPDYFYADVDPDKDLYLRVLGLIMQNPASINNIAELASLSDLRISKLYDVVKKYEGTTPGELIHRYRITKARQLLLFEGKGVLETAYAVGYNSISTFYERFKLFTGMTPKAFANSQS